MRRSAGLVRVFVVVSTLGLTGIFSSAPTGAASIEGSTLPGHPGKAVTASSVRPLASVRPHKLRAEESPITGQLDYNGGPVQTTPELYVDFWAWNGQDPDGEKPYLLNFLKSVGGSNWLHALGQYFQISQEPGNYAGTDPKFMASWNDQSNGPGADPTDAAIQAEAARAYTHFGITSFPVAAQDQMIVALPPGVGLANSSNPGACAYHGYLNHDTTVGGTYTVLPYMPTYSPGPSETCGNGYVNGGSEGDLDAISMTEGHEMAESITDPFADAWYDSGGNEVADKCAYYDTGNIVLSKGTFAVQPLWSDLDNGCVLGPADSWSPQTSIPKDFTSAAPSIAVYQGAVYEAFKGHTSENVYVTEDTGAGWTTEARVTGASTVDSPAATVDNGTLYVLWTDATTGDVEASHQIGSGWSTPTVIGAGHAESSAGPAVCAYGGTVLATFKGHTSDNVYVSVFNGSSWGAEVTAPNAATVYSPAIECPASDLVNLESVAWTTTGDQIQYDAFDGASSTFLGGPYSIPEAETNAGPAETYSALGDVVAWKGLSSDAVYYSVYGPCGTIWCEQLKVPKALTLNTPAVAGPGETVYAAWSGQKSDGLYYSASNAPMVALLQ